jgi:hypothetical protein
MTLNIYASADPDAKRRTMDNVFKTMEGGADAARVIPFDKTGTDGR